MNELRQAKRMIRALVKVDRAMAEAMSVMGDWDDKRELTVAISSIAVGKSITFAGGYTIKLSPGDVRLMQGAFPAQCRQCGHDSRLYPLDAIRRGGHGVDVRVPWRVVTDRYGSEHWFTAWEDLGHMHERIVCLCGRVFDARSTVPLIPRHAFLHHLAAVDAR